MPKVTISPPQSIAREHVLDDFDCGQPTLNDWLKKRAFKNEGDASRTFVVCVEDVVVGFYCLATGAVMHQQTPGKIKRNMPNPLPVMTLGRLAVDARYKGMGIGKGLLKDAILRADRVNKDVGFRALMVHALDEDAKRFYMGNGFIESPVDELLLFLPLPAVRPMEWQIHGEIRCFDDYLNLLILNKLNGRLAFIFYLEGEKADVIDSSDHFEMIIESIGGGQIIIAEGIDLQDVYALSTKHWDFFAVTAITCEKGGLPTFTYVQHAIQDIQIKMDQGAVEDLTFFKRDGSVYKIGDTRSFEDAVYETEIN